MCLVSLCPNSYSNLKRIVPLSVHLLLYVCLFCLCSYSSIQSQSSSFPVIQLARNASQSMPSEQPLTTTSRNTHQHTSVRKPRRKQLQERPPWLFLSCKKIYVISPLKEKPVITLDFHLIWSDVKIKLGVF